MTRILRRPHLRRNGSPRTGPAAGGACFRASSWLRVGSSRDGEPGLRRPYKRFLTGAGLKRTKSWNEGNSKTVLVNVTLYGTSSVVSLASNISTPGLLDPCRHQATGCVGSRFEEECRRPPEVRGDKGIRRSLVVRAEGTGRSRRERC